MGYKYEERMMQVITGFTCDICGGEFDGEGLMDCAVIDRSFGYNSGHGCTEVNAVLCGPCYYKLLKQVLPDRCFSDSCEDLEPIAFEAIRPLPGDPSQRLSKRLNLEFAYDYSNSKMSESVLIMKALEQYRFNDLLTLAQYFGLDQLRKGAAALYGDSLPKRLSAILNNIEVGLSDQE